MSRRGYLRFDPSLEQPGVNEDQAVKAIVASIQRTSIVSAKAHGHGIRQQHAKGHGFLRGELEVYDDLPVHLRQGLFAQAHRYVILLRFSTAFGDIRSDRVRVPRGMAIKVLGVTGPKASSDDRTSNQDFLLVNHKSYFADAKAYLTAQRLFEQQPQFPDIALRTLGFLSRGLICVANAFNRKLPMLFYALGDSGNNIVGETFYSEGAIRFGEYVARLSAAPISESALACRGSPAHDADDALQRTVTETFNQNSVEYELRAQLCVDLKSMPIEDASVDWPEEISPFQPLARIVIPAQAANSEARREYAQNVLSYDPWRCLADHQPLGSIMRLRREAYKASADFRRKQGPSNEPQDISEFPD